MARNNKEPQTTGQIVQEMRKQKWLGFDRACKAIPGLLSRNLLKCVGRSVVRNKKLLMVTDKAKRLLKTFSSVAGDRAFRSTEAF
jgi:hypothetical protein